MTISKATIRELKKLVKKKKYAKLQEKFQDIHPYDISDFLQRVSAESRNKVLSNLKSETLIDILPELPEEMQLEFVEILSPRQAAKLLSGIPPDEMADVLGDLSLDTRRKIVGYFSKEKTDEARGLLKYSGNTAGGLMTTEVIALQMETTAGAAMRYVRERAKEYETVYYLYVTDSQNRLIGVLSLRDLVLADPKAKLGEIMNPDVIKVPAEMDQEEVAYIIADYDLIVAPVVDEGDRLLGIVTVDDVIDVIEEEVTEDLAHLAGTAPKIDKLIDAPVFSVVKARLPWLVFALIGGLLAGSVIGVFENSLAPSYILLLALFIPVIMGMGGNVGIQSSTIFVRGLATGEIENPWRYFLREVKIGFVVGSIFGGGVGIVAHFWKGQLLIGGIVGIAMFITVMLASAVGIIIPKLFDYLGADPAISASPFVTTIQDITGLLIYFTIASFMLAYIV